MKKILIAGVLLAISLTGCAQNNETADASVQEAAAKAQQVVRDVVKSEEIMQRVETSSVAESALLPDNYPISYVPIIDGAHILEAESKMEAGKIIFHVVQNVNLTAEDAYKFYSEIYEESPSYSVTAQKQGENISIKRAKNGLNAALTFEANSEGTSQVIMEIDIAE